MEEFDHSIEEFDQAGQEKRNRRYSIVLDLGLGNFTYEEYGNSGDSGRQSVYTGDMLSLKALVSVAQTDNVWVIDIGGEIFGTTDRLERWWSGQELFQVNKLFVKGLCMETILGYNFEELALSPFPILAQPNLGFGLAYRFYGLRRNDVISFSSSEDNEPIPGEKDYAFFGFEPRMGLSFAMDDGKMTGYVNIGAGVYGVSVENNYNDKALSSSPNKTYGRSILSSIGLRGDGERFFYQLGYSVFRFKIDTKNSIPDARIGTDRIFCDIGVRF